MSEVPRMFSAVDVIQTKRDGGRLSDDQIDWVVDAYTRGAVAEEQMAALAMAIYCNGMDPVETARWTGAMIESGERLDLSGVTRPTVDKHSTGGVGDKITLPLAPLVAACGAAVPQLSGRGLGHTGGTLDKLESIPGWRATLSSAEIIAQLNSVGAVVCAATPTLAPADRKLYALRDVTGTVESIPLIASSIMSKKIAEGAAGLVLDVKVGSGAFMKTHARARELAGALVGIGAQHGLPVSALLTDMSTPLGRAVGNAIEVAESVEVLRGAGPADVVELTVALAREMLALAGLPEVDPAEVLASGRAYETWAAMIRAQGGDPEAPLPTARVVHVVEAAEDGILASLDAYPVGVAAWRLGAGRARKEDPVDHAAGVLCLAKPGDPVTAGQPLLELHTNNPDALPAALAVLDGAWTIGPAAPTTASRGPAAINPDAITPTAVSPTAANPTAVSPAAINPAGTYLGGTYAGGIRPAGPERGTSLVLDVLRGDVVRGKPGGGSAAGDDTAGDKDAGGAVGGGVVGGGGDVGGGGAVGGGGVGCGGGVG